METIFLILIGILSRLLPHPANMTAVGGVAIYSVAKLNTKKALIITLVTMFLSDAMIGFHSLMWATYGSLVIAVLIGGWVRQRISIGRILSGTLLASIFFFLITNFAVWVVTPLYQKTINGLITCFIMALPFFRNSLLGDMGYTCIIFMSHRLVLYTLRKIRMIFASKRYNKTDSVYA